MSFIQRELDKIEKALHEPQHKDKYDQLYAAQQALAWALEPQGFRNPYNTILDIPALTADDLEIRTLQNSCSDLPATP